MDDTEFKRTAEQHAGFVYNVALRMLGNAHDAEDVAQDALLSAWKARDRFRGDSQVTTWLYRITMNAALMRLRKEKRHSSKAGGDVVDLDVPAVDWTQSPQASALNAELSGRLKSAISGLPPDLRAAVVTRDVEGFSPEEAANVLGLSVPAFKARLYRGRLTLRKLLADYVRERGS
jgi:RNA polymerase sigma-70 factor (ECF subfamily)